MKILENNESTSSTTETRFIDAETTAKRFGVTVRTLQHWTRKHKLPVIKISKTVLYDWEKLEKAIVERFTVH